MHTAQVVLTSIPVDLSVHHVKSHQDAGDVLFSRLPLSAKLNIQADTLATSAYMDCPSPLVSPCSPEVFASLSILDVPVTSHLKDTLLVKHYAPKQLQYFHTTHGWSEDIFLTIDWVSSSRDLHHLPYGRKLAMFKLVNGQWPTYKQLHCRHQHPTPQCPRCASAIETNDHVLQCPSATAIRHKSWALVSQVLVEKLKTPPFLITALESGIVAWQEGRPTLWPFPPPLSTDPFATAVHAAHRQQSQIGWHHVFRGHISKQWGYAMSNYNTQRFSTPSNAATWTRPMIRSFRSFSSTQWQDRNDFVHGATVQAAAVKRLRTLVIAVTAAYQHPLSVPIDERGHLFGLPLSQRLQLTPSKMKA